MKKRFFYAASIDSSNMPEVRLSGCIDAESTIDAVKIVNIIKSECEEKGYTGVSIHISQLKYLRDVIDDVNT
jgi:hypothetical protein